MLTKSTLWELWRDFSSRQFSACVDGCVCIKSDFLGWESGTDVRIILEWFDEQCRAYGGVRGMLNGYEYPERGFKVDTPDGILYVESKHVGVDCMKDYPGVYINLVRRDESSGEAICDMICVVEYDSGRGRLQIVPYAELGNDEPTLGYRWDPACAGVIPVCLGEEKE